MRTKIFVENYQKKTKTRESATKYDNINKLVRRQKNKLRTSPSMDNSMIGEIHRVVAGWDALKAMLVTLRREATPRNRNFASLDQAERMVIVAEIMDEAQLQEPERSLLYSFIDTRPGMGYLGINDPRIPTRQGPLPLPADMQDPSQGEEKKNVNPNAGPHQDE